jgi:hypothetical protein
MNYAIKILEKNQNEIISTIKKLNKHLNNGTIDRQRYDSAFKINNDNLGSIEQALDKLNQ